MLQVFDVEEVSRAVEQKIAPQTSDRHDDHYPLDDLSDEDLFHAGAPRALIPAIRGRQNR